MKAAASSIVIEEDEYEVLEFKWALAMGEVHTEAGNLVVRGISDASDVIEAIDDLDALIAKLQRVKSELQKCGSNIDGTFGRVRGGVPADLEALEARTA
ncbi:hypothetical protein KEU06_09600 [Pseudaminobacter sp. 19-2017]|uniref:Uncharacterized protein n=1 Tax=Pseudaminobacter soli (ex Zhang et al. 2022) TaxID=2831468 RepID=A0A942I7Z7_9HYPH|nr:hypothetical protein [Pseudaminobacter soli]MBS3648860.1 hypothetical protein [Pseudaminobacter soli]